MNRRYRLLVFNDSQLKAAQAADEKFPPSWRR
jgi:hypothetical protein